MSNKLNANASSFTPGGNMATGNFNDSFVQMAEDIENDLAEESTELTANDTSGGNAAAASSGLPPHMQKHAAEFWFPESRNCECCKGYKHGCACQASNNGTCASCASSN